MSSKISDVRFPENVNRSKIAGDLRAAASRSLDALADRVRELDERSDAGVLDARDGEDTVPEAQLSHLSVLSSDIDGTDPAAANVFHDEPRAGNAEGGPDDDSI